MPKTYALTEAATALTTDLKSLHRWIKLEKWNLEEQGENKYDKRIKTLTEEQVILLAKAHNRMWPPEAQPGAIEQSHGTPSAFKQLEGRVKELEAANHVDPDQLDDWMKDAAARITELEHKYSDTLVRLSDALLELKELKDWKASLEVKPKVPRKTKKADPNDPDYQAGLQAVIDNGD